MKSREQRLAILFDSLQDVGISEIQMVKPTICAPYGDNVSDLGFEPVSWAPMIYQGTDPIPKDHDLFTQNRIFSIGLSSVLACLQLDLKPNDTLLDTCAAPGIKSLYLQFLHNNTLDLHVNDVSQERLFKLRRLFEQFDRPLPTFNHRPAHMLNTLYKEQSFDAIFIDAPCSGEGTILGGDMHALEQWSLAKVKGLAQRQRKILLTAKKLVKQNGQLIYATCTLNKTENEHILKKVGSPVQVEATLIKEIRLKNLEAVRILPSAQSIGFFIAKLQ